MKADTYISTCKKQGKNCYIELARSAEPVQWGLHGLPIFYLRGKGKTRHGVCHQETDQQQCCVF